MEGGTAQGLGYALLENVVMRNGAMANSTLTNYTIPTTLDMPEMDVVMLENPYPGGPFGAKGLGELPMDGPAPAVVNALRNFGRDVHSPNDHGGADAFAGRNTRRYKGHAGREPVSLHRILGHLSRRDEVARDHERRSQRKRAAGGSLMRTPVSEMDMRSARTLDEAFAILRAEPRTPVAGATDVYVGANFGTLSARRFLNIWGIDELREISIVGDLLVIGALATYTSLIKSQIVRDRLPMLVQASQLVGGAQIQNRGTVGGNIANGSPAGDSLPVFAAADAVIVLRSPSAERRVPFTQFYTGYRATVVRPDELLTAIEIPRVEGKQWFRKVGTRAAQAISKIVVAAIRAREPRIAFGSVAATVIRVPKTEAALASGVSIEEAAKILGAEIAPIDDLRSSAEYRRRVSVNLLKQCWAATA